MSQCDNCKLSHLGYKYRVCIPPPPDKIRGCLISRDPTYKFWTKVETYKQVPSDQRGNLCFKNSPPEWLFKKIVKFDITSEEKKNLEIFLHRECYWTHFHKCPTKSRNNEDINQDEMNDLKEDCQQFKYSIGESCANLWFKSEFDKYNLNDKIIIALGSDVKKFFTSWSNSHNLDPEKIFYLPHPSGRCRLWNENSDQKEHIKYEINRLLKLI